MAITSEKVLETGRNVLSAEAESIQKLSSSLGASFIDAVFLLLNKKGKIVFTGVGKSGHIAQKLAATFTSTGMRSIFLHPTEAAHGDIGILEEGDVVVAISNSGETDELIQIIPTICALHINILGITSNKDSTLARHSNVLLLLPEVPEAGILGLAPTTSTTTTLALGDALACACMLGSGLTEEKFAFSHPAGRLGRRLTLRVRDLMKIGEDIPVANPDDLLLDALGELTDKHLGCIVATNVEGVPLGIFTEGDLGRLLRKNVGLANVFIKDVITLKPKFILEDTLAYDALKTLTKNQINQLLVVDKNGKLTGLIHIQNIIDSRI